MVTKIAILAWGSLIWKPGVLKISGDWDRDGPVLPIEFSRISDNGRLTLVIDEKDGVDTVTRYAVSEFPELDAAIKNLQEREGAPNQNRIGFVDLPRDRTNDWAAKQHPNALRRIRVWAAQRKIEAVIWTAIGPRFLEKRGEPFSPDAALRYLKSLDEPTRAMALEYILKAPSEVRTSVRRKVEFAFRAPSTGHGE